MSATNLSDVALGSLAGSKTNVSCVYFGDWIDPILSSGTVQGTDDDGDEVAGLTIGKYHSIEATGGPWNYGSGNAYGFSVSQNGGVSWQGNIGWTDFTMAFETSLPAWADYLLNLDGLRGRMFWQATTTSIRFRCADYGGFGDNSGDLGWALRAGQIGTFLSGVRLG